MPSRQARAGGRSYGKREKLREKGVFDFKFVLRVIGIAYFLIGIAYFLWVNYFSLSEW